MIYIFQDESKISNEWLQKVANFQKELEKLTSVEERKAYIKTKQSVWGEIKDSLLEMSHGKCWYSEAPDAVSDWHVDHFRPKSRALDEDRTKHPGYDWLAFDWKNYRIAGSYPNSPHTDNEGITRGKWDYFPLVKNTPRASWDDRDLSKEIILLLDPTKKTDPKLMTFDEKGLPIPSDPYNPIIKKRVETTVHYLYLDSPRLVAARKKKWREIMEWIETYREVCPNTIDECTPADYRRFEKLLNRIQKLSGPDASFAATARACLRANALEQFLQVVEDANF
ncbi:hypothetical protein [Acinetobacter radioresistens]|uniref:hypothetical protein n=1 Tax=Acinetobacter radioresistens TaxID=40216 RepID=UPI0020053270|nr:hypothetical protein [Acinetobacter radioresistens]MCK4106602.1 hypothetical protein [Acinetobacter radioresistens]